MKQELRVYRSEAVAKVREQLLKNMLAEDDYTIRLWNAEAALQDIGYQRGVDGLWRKRMTLAEYHQMLELKELSHEKATHSPHLPSPVLKHSASPSEHRIKW